MKKSYITPNVQVIDVAVEQCIANSPSPSIVDERANEDEGRSSEYRNNLWN